MNKLPTAWTNSIRKFYFTTLVFLITIFTRSVTINLTIYVCTHFDSIFPVLPRIRFILCSLARFQITILYMGNYYIRKNAITY